MNPSVLRIHSLGGLWGQLYALGRNPSLVPFSRSLVSSRVAVQEEGRPKCRVYAQCRGTTECTTVVPTGLEGGKGAEQKGGRPRCRGGRLRGSAKGG